MTAQEARKKICEIYKSIIGRNDYSQSLRDYCFRKYRDGKYYSDCSSSISYCYKEAGFGFGILNTVGMYQGIGGKFTEVSVNIKNGVIQNPEVLRIGDMLLFAGTDSGRKYAGYVGHVEMVGEITGSTVWLYGHGSGKPKRHEMNAYCRERYSAKTGTALGRKLLIKVIRYIEDDGSEQPEKLETRVLKNGMVGADVKDLQTALINLGYDLGKYGADGDFGDCTELAVRDFQFDAKIGVDGEVGKETAAALTAALESDAPPKDAKRVKIVNGNCYVRMAPNTDGAKLGIARSGESYDYGGQTSDDGWNLIDYNNSNGWVSGKYSRLEDAADE